MLDENLPAFILKQSSDGIKHHKDIYLAYQGNDPVPNYLLHHADPATTNPTHKNCYAAAIFDCYNTDVLYGEVLARPAWTQPTLSAEELRRYNGVPPPPQPILPNDFTIQLYNPDQQIKVEIRPGKWGSSDSYEFSMPQNTFREPSSSNIDRGQSDPSTLHTTPKLHFVWRRESKLSKDLTCYMTGRSTDTFDRRKARKDPDIAIALWRNMRELTIYEPNTQRLELEDPKGLEVVLLLGAIVIKDLFFTSKEHVRELFGVGDAYSGRKLSNGGRKLSDPQESHLAQPPMPPRGASMDGGRRADFAGQPYAPPPTSPGSRPPPMADPRSQWELEAETARLRAQAEAEAREHERRRREKERADEMERQRLIKALEQEKAQKEREEEAERKRLKKMMEQEEKEARRKQAEIDKETERLRKLYGVPTPPEERNKHRASFLGDNGLYQQGAGSSAFMMSGANPGASNLNAPNKPAKKKSFFGLRSASNEG